MKTIRYSFRRAPAGRRQRLANAPHNAQRNGRRRGAALVEFALIAVMFFTMLLGMLQFGIYQSSANTLWTMSREGARLASVQSAGVAGANENIYNRVLDAAPPNIDKTNYNTSENPGGSGKLTILIEPKTASARTSGSTVRVSIEYNMTDKMIVPMASLLFPADLRNGEGKVIYKTFTSMRVE